MSIDTATITSLITIASMLVACIVWIIRLEGKVNMVEKENYDNKESIGTLFNKHTLLQTDVNSQKVDIGVMTESLKHIDASLTEIKNLLNDQRK